MEPLKIGIAGAGGIAQRNAREAAASGAAKVVGVFDVNHRAARDMAQALKVPFSPATKNCLAARTWKLSCCRRPIICIVR